MLSWRRLIQFITYRFLTRVAFALISQCVCLCLCVCVCVCVFTECEACRLWLEPLVTSRATTHPMRDIQTIASSFRYFSVLDREQQPCEQWFIMISECKGKKCELLKNCFFMLSYHQKEGCNVTLDKSKFVHKKVIIIKEWNYFFCVVFAAVFWSLHAIAHRADSALLGLPWSGSNEVAY